MKKLLLILMMTPFISLSQVYVDSIPGEQIVEHTSYTLSYNEYCEQASYVSYIVTKDRLEHPVIDRKDRFKSDKSITTQSASTKDYSKSGYDRGHLAPCAVMLHDTLSMYESFYMSNMSPQLPGFNRGVWKKLESYVRKTALEADSIYVITGPALIGELDEIGTNSVCIPNYYYKILTIKKDGIYSITCYLLPNAKSSEDLDTFIVSMARIEEITGLNFKLK